MEHEIWKDIPNNEGKYQVSTLGNVKSLDYIISNNNKQYLHKGRILKNQLNKYGYYSVSINEGKKCIHKIMAITFLNHKECKYEKVINHINGIKTDNRLENIEIVSHRYNVSDGKKRNRNLPTGVTFDRNKYKADIQIKNKHIFLGRFDNIDTAKYIYELAVKNEKEYNFDNSLFRKNIKNLWLQK